MTDKDRKRRITDLVLVPLCDMFEDGEFKDAVAVLTHMKIKNVKALYIAYSGICLTIGGSEAAFTTLGDDMKEAGTKMKPQVQWTSGRAMTPTQPSRASTRAS